MRKKLKFQLRYLAIAILLTLFIVACQSNPVSQPTDLRSPDCRTVQHVMGEVCLPSIPQRVITLDETTLGNTLALGGSSLAVTLYGEPANYLTEKSGDLEILGRGEMPSLEKIYQLNPDLIVGIELFTKPIYQKLSEIAPTALGKWNGYPSWREHFNFVARVLAKEAKAQEVWQNYDRRIEELKTALGNPQELEISLAYAFGDRITMDAENSFAGSILADLGVRRPPSQAAVNDGTIPLSEERISDLDADILFVSVFDRESEQVLANWQQKPLWNQLQVVQNQQVYLVEGNIWRAGDPIAANLVIDDLFKYLVKS